MLPHRVREVALHRVEAGKAFIPAHNHAQAAVVHQPAAPLTKLPPGVLSIRAVRGRLWKQGALDRQPEDDATWLGGTGTALCVRSARSQIKVVPLPGKLPLGARGRRQYGEGGEGRLERGGPVVQAVGNRNCETLWNELQQRLAHPALPIFPSGQWSSQKKEREVLLVQGANVFRQDAKHARCLGRGRLFVLSKRWLDLQMRASDITCAATMPNLLGRGQCSATRGGRSDDFGVIMRLIAICITRGILAELVLDFRGNTPGGTSPGYPGSQPRRRRIFQRVAAPSHLDRDCQSLVSAASKRACARPATAGCAERFLVAFPVKS